MKAAWLNVPFFFGRTLVLALVLFATCYAFAGALLRDSVPPDDERDRARRNRLAVILLILWLDHGVAVGLRPRDGARPRSGTAASSAATSS